MSSNVGLSTPRGSGTSGYVQRNLSALNPNKKPTTSRFAPYPQSQDETDRLRHKARQPDQKILAHDRAREIEVKVFALRDKLEEDEVEDEEIDKQCDELRQKLEREGSGKDSRNGRNIKRFQVHELAAAKIEESEKLRQALGIRKDYEEGSHWKKGQGEIEERLKRGLREDSDGEMDTPGKRERKKSTNYSRDSHAESR